MREPFIAISREPSSLPRGLLRANNRLQRTALRAAAEPERYAG